MHRPGHDPTRRNRNQGTGKRGHGRDNRMVIPWTENRRFFESLCDPVRVRWFVTDPSGQ